MNLNFNTLIPIKGDASFRKFYRYKKNKQNSIVVFSKKEKFKNLVIYELINRILIKNKIKAPKLLSENIKKNYIIIEDLGNYTIYQKIKNNTIKRKTIYKRIVELLLKIQKIRIKKIKDINKKYYVIPKYTNKLMFQEVELFLRWYVPKFYNGAEKKKLINC